MQEFLWVEKYRPKTIDECILPSQIKKEFSVPVFSYHVSGEYSMIKSAALKKYIDEESSVLEAMYCFKRAGCNAVLTYYTPEIIKWLNKN